MNAPNSSRFDVGDGIPFLEHDTKHAGEQNNDLQNSAPHSGQSSQLVFDAYRRMLTFFQWFGADVSSDTLIVIGFD